MTPSEMREAKCPKCVELESTLRRCGLYSSMIYGELKSDLEEIGNAAAVPPEQMDELINERFSEMECKLAERDAEIERLTKENGRYREALEHILVSSPCRCEPDFTERDRHASDCPLEQRETAQDALKEQADGE